MSLEPSITGFSYYISSCNLPVFALLVCDRSVKFSWDFLIIKLQVVFEDLYCGAPYVH